MPNTEDKDIYVQLIEDVLGQEINPFTPILQSVEEKNTASKEAKELDDALLKSCEEFKKHFGFDEIIVGSAPQNEVGYIEPCPVQYTGDISNGKKFHCVIIGLNPHLDNHRWRPFESNTTFADLANFHHPNDVHNNYQSERYSSDGEIKNNYWRVMGNMKYFEPKNRYRWSKYYKDIIRLYLALLPKDLEEIHNTNEDAYLDSLVEHTLDRMAEYPIANFEFIPYKSENFNIKKFMNILNDENLAADERNFADRYKKYIQDMVKFIDKYTSDDAYIIATASLKDNMFDSVYEILKRTLTNSHPDKEHDYFVYSLKDRDFEHGKRLPYEFAHTYLFKWGNRKVIIAPSISGHGEYTWIYDFSKGWINAIKKHAWE